MKKDIILAFIFLILLSFISYAEEVSCIIIPSKFEIKADGKDSIFFSVKLIDEAGNLKNASKFSIIENGRKIEKAFTTTVPGIYYFKAIVGKIESKNVAITAVQSKKSLLKKYLLKDGNNNIRLETTYEYDKNGNPIKSSNKNIDGTVVERYTEYKYDKNGNILTATFKDSTGEITGYSEYEYDSKNNQVKFVQKSKDGSIISEIEWQYTYYKNGNKQSEQKVTKDKNGNVTNIKETIYDENGRKLNEKQVFRDRRGNTILETEIKYDLYGNKIKEENRNKDGLLVKIVEYEYDKFGNIYMEITKDRYDNVMGKKEYSYETNKNGLKEKQIVKTIDESGLLTSIAENYYNRYGNVIKYVLKDSNENITEFGELKYDKNGNVVEETVYDKDNNLLSMAVSQYTH